VGRGVGFFVGWWGGVGVSEMPVLIFHQVPDMAGIWSKEYLRPVLPSCCNSFAISNMGWNWGGNKSEIRASVQLTRGMQSCSGSANLSMSFWAYRLVSCGLWLAAPNGDFLYVVPVGVGILLI